MADCRRTRRRVDCPWRRIVLRPHERQPPVVDSRRSNDVRCCYVPTHCRRRGDAYAATMGLLSGSLRAALDAVSEAAHETVCRRVRSGRTHFSVCRVRMAVSDPVCSVRTRSIFPAQGVHVKSRSRTRPLAHAFGTGRNDCGSYYLDTVHYTLLAASGAKRVSKTR